MTGLGGNDTYYVDNVGDKVVEGASQGRADTVITSLSYTLAAGVEIERILPLTDRITTALELTGNEFGQIIAGNNGDNKIDGKAGADTMQGNGGNDTYYVDNAGDIINEASNGGTLDWAASSVSYILSGNAYVEQLSTTASHGTAAIDLTGNATAQVVIGNAGANTINGKGGNDTLTGLGGADIFFFDTVLNVATNVDTITDFDVADDSIQLENAIFTRIAGSGTLTAEQFYKSDDGVAHDADDRIIYETDTGKLFYDRNGSADGGSVQFATLTANLALTNADFVVI